MKTNFNFKETEYNVKKYIELIVKDLSKYEFKTFNLGCSYPNILDEDEKLLLKKEFQYILTKEVEKQTNSIRLPDNYDIEILIDFNYKNIEYKIFPIYIYGIYNKYSRELPQTKYYCFKCRGRGCNFCGYKGVLKDTSLEEKISLYFKDFSATEECIFHGAGREDVNVLMLGNGREFILEVIEPLKRNIENLNEIEKKINLKETDLKVTNLKLEQKVKVKEIKQKKLYKLYRANITLTEEIKREDLNKIPLNIEIDVVQTTPKRVEKRRANLDRKRKCTILKTEFISEKEIIVEIKAEAGLYIKEFISSDDIRTTPSIKEYLKKNCVCSQLDVIWIYRY